MSDAAYQKLCEAVAEALAPGVTLMLTQARRDALAPIRALLDTPAIRAADGNGSESFVSVADLRADLR